MGKQKLKYLYRLMIFIFILIIINCFPSIVKAVTLDDILNASNPVGWQVDVNDSEFRSRDKEDLFCVQYWYWFHGTCTFRVSNYVQIRGNVARDVQSGITVTNSLNAEMAYIVSHTEGLDSTLIPTGLNLGEESEYSRAQWAVYKTINSWYSNVGTKFGLNWGWARNDGNPEAFQDETDDRLYKAYLDWQIYNETPVYKEYMEEAKEYANDIANASSTNQVTAKDNTNKDSLTITHYKENNIDYVKVGPFNWEFSGNLTSITLTGDNGATPELVLYKANATTKTSVEKIKSKEDFYIAFRQDSNISHISKIEGKGVNASVDIINANLFFMEVVSSAEPDFPGVAQKIMLTETEPVEPTKYTITIENIPISIDFSIVKVDKDNSSKKLEGVGFSFYNVEMGKYLKQNGNNVEFVNNSSDATEYITDTNGKIQIKGVPMGTYLAYETKNPDQAYEVSSEPIEFTPTNNRNITITNETTSITITIEKVDADNKSIKIEGVGFKFYNQDEKKYIKKSGNTYEYVSSINDATEFKTDRNGKIQLEYVKIGKYLAYETSMENKAYEIAEKPVEIQVTKNTKNIQITNQKKYITVTIEKVDADNKSIKIPGVGFKFYNKEQRKYVKKSGDTYEYVNSIEQATEFITDRNGKIQLDYIEIGNYLAYETSMENKAYEIAEDPVEIEITKNTTNVQITNEVKFVTVTIEKVDEDDTSIKIEGAGFKFYNQDEKKYIKKSGDTYEYVNSINEATEFKTDKNGNITLEYIKTGKYLAYETSMEDKGYEVLDEPIEIEITKDTVTIQITNKLKYVVIEIQKVDKYKHDKTLEGVGFKFYNVDEGKYVKQVGNTYEYVNSMNAATEFFTDKQGKIKLEYVLKGKYIAYETANPNYGYVAGEEYEIEAPKDISLRLENEIKYVRLTGLVWEDIQSEKMSKRNDLYRLDRNDDRDEPVPGVKVTLKDRTTGREVTDRVEGLEQGQELITKTQTNQNGQYQFDYVPIDSLKNYYIEFEYDGLIYEDVIPHLENEEKGSKAEEPNRQEFNNKFNSMDKGSGDMQTVADQNGNSSRRPTINYDVAETGDGGRILEMTSTENTEIIATTDEAGYIIEYDKEEATAEVSNINLGIYKRAQTDLALQTEIEEIKAEINGYGHIYHYGPMYDTNNAQQVESSWDLGIRYQNQYQYKGTYERPIYKADAEYTNDTYKNKELQLLLTYKITLRNQGSVYGRVNSVAVYFDSRYDDQVVAIGTVLDSKGNIKGTTLQGQPQQSNVNGYKKVMIDTRELGIIDHSATESTGDNKVTEQSLYIQFRLPREVIAEMIKEGDTPSNNLNFTAEIGSYTSYSDDRGNTLYAAYDVDSVPDNAQVGNESTYEDDTDKASQVALTIANARTISGMVFEDIKEESAENVAENVAEGNGRKDETETNLTGVKVELIDVSDGQVAQIYDEGSDTWANVSYDVDNSGNYQIAGFIPGEYQVRFTWGDRTQRVTEMPDSEPITVENYKSTIIDYEKYERYDDLPNGAKERYYLSDYGILEENYSIALDDQNIRKQIDESLEEYNFSTDAVDSSGNPITEMQSNTWNMEFPIEYDSEPADGTDILDKLEVTTDARGDTSFTIEFPVANINLGIIKRPEQNIELTKTIDSFKFVLPTGQVLIDAKLNEDGTVSGTTNYLSYIQGPTPEESLLRAELDENLIQGSRVDITYRLEIKNTSEADYSSEWYYNYGEKYYELTGELDKNNDIITLSPLKVIDYLNENSQINEDSQINKDYKWQSISINEIESQEMLTTDVINELKGTGSLELEDYQIYVTDISSIIQTENTGEINFNLKPEYWVGTTLGNGAENTEDIQIETSQPLGNAEDSVYRNQAEIVLVVKTGGGRLISTPGNYVPNYNSEETPDEDDGGSPPATVIPSTGADKNYVIPIFVIIMTFVLLGVGIYLIKVKVLRTKK